MVSTRQLNRTLLARQLLLERDERPVLDAVEHLVGLQAQEPHDPYLALWSRLRGFDPHELSGALERRAAVRVVVMRGTIHLVTADDCFALRPAMQPVLDGELRRHQEHAAALRTTDMGPVLAAIRPVVDAAPCTPRELRALIAERCPDVDAAAAAYACRNLLTMVQVPPRGLWRRGGTVRTTTAEAWLGRSAPGATVDELVLRYLAAFGPATPADASTWTRLTGMREVFERLRPQLRTYRDDRGRELFDLPELELADPDLPAPVRFLPQYDNALLSHDDRTRIVPDPALWAGLEVQVGQVLLDGFVQALWWREDGGRRLVLRSLRPLPAGARDRVAAEGRRAVRFLTDGEVADPDVRFEVRP